jgi:hypothetical protein
MIISHKHKFIFIKTEKTAGTSMEIALSKYCGPDDVITPIAPGDEKLRQELGYRGPQNYHVPLRKHTKVDLLRFIYNRTPISFYNHASAAYIMKYLDQDIWDAYFKFCFERNPYDKVISMYSMRAHNRKNLPSLSEYIQSGQANMIQGFDLYTYLAEIVVDKVFLYEQLDQAIKEISEYLGLEELISLPRAKGGYRKDKRSYRDLMTDADREKIAKVYAREIAHFGYEW